MEGHRDNREERPDCIDPYQLEVLVKSTGLEKLGSLGTAGETASQLVLHDVNDAWKCMAADIHAHAGNNTLMGSAEPVLNLCGAHGDENGAST